MIMLYIRCKLKCFVCRLLHILLLTSIIIVRHFNRYNGRAGRVVRFKWQERMKKLRRKRYQFRYIGWSIFSSILLLAWHIHFASSQTNTELNFHNDYTTSFHDKDVLVQLQTLPTLPVRSVYVVVLLESIRWIFKSRFNA